MKKPSFYSSVIITLSFLFLIGVAYAATPYPTVSLSRGSTNTAGVQQLQTYLVSIGLLKQSDIDNGGYGVYGPRTEAAVGNLQTWLNVDAGSNWGAYGPRTLAALNQATNNGQLDLNSPSTLPPPYTNLPPPPLSLNDLNGLPPPSSQQFPGLLPSQNLPDPNLSSVSPTPPPSFQNNNPPVTTVPPPPQVSPGVTTGSVCNLSSPLGATLALPPNLGSRWTTHFADNEPTPQSKISALSTVQVYSDNPGVVGSAGSAGRYPEFPLTMVFAIISPNDNLWHAYVVDNNNSEAKNSVNQGAVDIWYPYPDPRNPTQTAKFYSKSKYYAAYLADPNNKLKKDKLWYELPSSQVIRQLAPAHSIAKKDLYKADNYCLQLKHLNEGI